MTTKLDFLDDDTRRVVAEYASANGCTEEEAMNALLRNAPGAAGAAASAHLAKHRGMALKDDGGTE